MEDFRHDATNKYWAQKLNSTVNWPPGQWFGVEMYVLKNICGTALVD